MLVDIDKTDEPICDELDDYIVGGAKVVNSICNSYTKVFKTQRCNCGLFQGRRNSPMFNICDNCMWAESPYESSEILFCSKTPLGKTLK